MQADRPASIQREAGAPADGAFAEEPARGMTMDRLKCYRGPLDGEERDIPSDRTHYRAQILVYDEQGTPLPEKTWYAIYERRKRDGSDWLVYQEEQLEWIECIGGSKHEKWMRVSPNDIWVRVWVAELLAIDIYERVQQPSGSCMLVWRRMEPK